MSQRASDVAHLQGGENTEPDVEAVVHDLRAPLSVISGYADLLGSGDLGALPEPARRAVAALAGKAAEMRALLDGLLDTARPEEGVDAARTVRPLDLRTVAREAVERALPRTALTGDSLELVTDGPTPVRADPRFLHRILDNLINNALNHGRRPGSVVVTVRRQGGYGEIVVADDGTGISAGARERLFSRFARRDENPASDSSGLGLYICRTLAERIGATIRCEDSDGGGAAFVVELPLAL